MPSAVFEPAIPTIERPQTYALDHTATESGYSFKSEASTQDHTLSRVPCHFLTLMYVGIAARGTAHRGEAGGAAAFGG
jgi:hypothetical protein